MVGITTVDHMDLNHNIASIGLVGAIAFVITQKTIDFETFIYSVLHYWFCYAFN
jgi:hypothetical protein